MIAMEVLWTLGHHRLQPKKKTSLIGHHMVVVLLLSLLTSYTNTIRCLLATAMYCSSCGKLRFYCTMMHRCFSTTVSFAEQLMRHPLGESHRKASTSLTLDHDPTMHLRGWKVYTKSGIGTLDWFSRACWKILSFRTFLIMRLFNNMMLMVTANMKMLCREIGLGNRL